MVSNPHSVLSPEVAERAERERAFFNQHTDPTTIPDELLLVPAILDSIPPEMADLFPSLKGKKICEIGCGYGVVCCHFAQRGALVCGVDVSDTNILVAERATQLNQVKDQVSLYVMQAESLAFPDNTFDLVFGNAVLHHLDIVASAREIYRVLKPGGVAIFREPLGENRLLEWFRNSRFRSSSHRHTPDEHSLLYSDADAVRTVFSNVVFRESELLNVFSYLLRKTEVGMIAVPRWDRAAQHLASVDRWLLARLPFLRRLASYSVVSMFKPAPLSIVPESNDAA